ncbi:hypothetical protein P8605_14625 [Streptomyces sp. T-3]|nr:hypothetical protein [Streptomyces sp. T-3]
MSFLYSDSVDGLEVFLSRVRNATAACVPAYWGLLAFWAKEEGWHWSFLFLAVLPPLACYLGFRAKREIRMGMAWLAAGLAIAPLLLVGAGELLFRL